MGKLLKIDTHNEEKGKKENVKGEKSV